MLVQIGAMLTRLGQHWPDLNRSWSTCGPSSSNGAAGARKSHQVCHREFCSIMLGVSSQLPFRGPSGGEQLGEHCSSIFSATPAAPRQHFSCNVRALFRGSRFSSLLVFGDTEKAGVSLLKDMEKPKLCRWPRPRSTAGEAGKSERTDLFLSAGGGPVRPATQLRRRERDKGWRF